MLFNKVKQEEFEEIIYFITKKIIEENYPDEMIFFELSWDGFRYVLGEWIKKQPEEWSLEDYRKQILPYFASPEQVNQSGLLKAGTIIIATSIYIENLQKMPSKEKIKKIVENFCDQFGVQIAFVPDIVSLVMKYLKKEKIASTKTEKEYSPSVDYEEDKLEIGFLKGRPYVKINGKENIEFRTKHKQFVNLVVLAAARRAEEDWVNKGELDPGQGDQILSDIRTMISRSLFYRIKRDEIIISDEQRNKFVKLGVFRSKKNIIIMESICKYKSVFLERAKKLINKIEKDIKLLERGDIKKSIIKKECKTLDKQASIMEKQMKCMERGLKKVDLELNDKEWKVVLKRSFEILEQLGHEFKYLIH
ncbi:MAG: hypothetical protein ACOC5T_09695 [Elusimicrobiota bacterium]